MSSFQYTLEKYSGPGSRFCCPSCQTPHKFTRYIDTATGQHLSPLYGKCDRELSCGYHLNPYHDGFVRGRGEEHTTPSAKEPESDSTTFIIPEEYYTESINTQSANSFSVFLRYSVGSDLAENALTKYGIGTNNDLFVDAAVFWIRDIDGLLRGAQVIQFDGDGHTQRYRNEKGESRRCNGWIHSALQKRYKKYNHVPAWLIEYATKASKYPCLFGEHLLRTDETKPVAIVESAKTAVIASIYLPQFIWLAAGGISYLTPRRCSALKDRTVVLFPDLGGLQKWTGKSKEITPITRRLAISKLLENKATEEQKGKGLDIADFLLQWHPKDFLQPGAEFTQPTQPNPKPIVLLLPLVQEEECDFSDEVREHPFCISTELTETWDSEIQELQSFFGSISVPKEPFRLNRWTVVTDCEKFIRGHLEFITQNNGKASYKPYLERLVSLRELLAIHPADY